MGRQRKYATLEELYARRNEDRQRQRRVKKNEHTQQTNLGYCTVALNAYNIHQSTTKTVASSPRQSSPALGIADDSFVLTEIPLAEKLYAQDKKRQKLKQISSLNAHFDSASISLLDNAAVHGNDSPLSLIDIHVRPPCNFCTHTVACSDHRKAQISELTQVAPYASEPPLDNLNARITNIHSVPFPSSEQPVTEERFVQIKDNVVSPILCSISPPSDNNAAPYNPSVPGCKKLLSGSSQSGHANEDPIPEGAVCSIWMAIWWFQRNWVAFVSSEWTGYRVISWNLGGKCRQDAICIP